MINKNFIKDKERLRWALNKRVFKIVGKEPLPIIKVKGREVIFVHISKTAGTSITEALKYKAKIHFTSTEIINLLGRKRWDGALSFAFVRNPWDRATSHYRYLVKAGSFTKQFGDITFKDWLKRAHSGTDIRFYEYESPKMYLPQLDWITDFSGNVCVDFIGKFENIQQDFQQLNSLIGTDAKLEHLNKTHEGNYSYRDY